MSKKILKRSLALGALMAFVITGNAMAAKEIHDTRYLELQGDSEIVDSNISTTDRLSGGWYNNPDKSIKPASTDLAVSGGNWNIAAGGHWAQYFDGKIETNLESTNMKIDGATIYHLVGGSVATGTKEVAYNTTSTNLNIIKGTFGRDSLGTNCPENVVVAGDFLRWYSADGKGTGKLISNIGTTNLDISGGIFDSLIIGGSAAIEYYSNGDAEIITATVETANTNITGGTFNRPIVAGGLAWGAEKVSTVDTANLTISGASGNLSLNDDADIFSGGVYGHYMGDDATVEVSNVKIDNATVSDIYGCALKWDLQGPLDNLSEDFVALGDKPVNTNLTLTNVEANTVNIPQGTVILKATADSTDGTRIDTLTTGNGVKVSLVGSGETNDALNGNADEFVDKFYVGESDKNLDKTTTYMEAGKATGQVDIEVEHITEEDYKQGYAEEDEIGTFKVVKATEQVNTSNAGANDMAAIGLMSWRAETDDMNKRMGELRDANGEHGVWVRMVRGEDEYGSVKNQYNQYQIGYDEKLSVDKRWTVGAAISYTDAENSFAQGNGESTNKALSLYGSKLNNDGTYVDLIAKYARLENDFKIVGGMGDADYSTNGYSFSAEAGKRIAQGNGLWIEPQVQLTYGKVSAVDYVSKNGTNISQDSMESIIGRVGFRLGKDIKQGNVYARASYLYDFDGETETRVSAGNATRPFENDLGGGWWEVGVGANINLSDATYIYADVEKTFGGEVDTNWQWNLGVRYSF